MRTEVGRYNIHVAQTGTDSHLCGAVGPSRTVV